MTKITIASTHKTWYTDALKNTQHDKNITLDTQNICCIDDLQNVGDVIYWRSSSIENNYPTVVQRSNFLLEAQKLGKIIINETLLTNPFLSYKSHQQTLVRTTSPWINTIPTFTASNVDEIKKLVVKKVLSFPFIAKPDHGSQGTDIFLIKSMSELQKINSISKYIFQNFIQNNGDYRVYIIGGTTVEIIKRTASKDSFLNNISQGGSVEIVSDIDLRDKLSTLATRIATVTNLSICGIDIIQDAVSKKYYFLEVNTVAQWKGLQSISKIDIAQSIIDHLTSIGTRTKQKDTLTLIEKYYIKNLKYLSQTKQFHFYSRLYLVTKDDRYLKELKKLQSWYTWEETTLQNSLETIFKNSKTDIKKVTNGYIFRKETAKKYPLLGTYNKILYKTLFTKTIYDIDYRARVVNLLKNTDIQKYRKLLSKDEHAIFTLSTHAINFIYLSSWLFDEPINIDIDKLLTITRKGHLNQRNNTIISRIYLLTHSIIGASLFYSQKISTTNSNYLEIIKYLEDFITKEYTFISLDQKCEFLVCARMLDYKTHLQKTIEGEASLSLSIHGNYIVDIFNVHKDFFKTSFSLSEHRNVLYLLNKILASQKSKL